MQDIHHTCKCTGEMICQMSLIDPKRVQIQPPKQCWTRYRIGPPNKIDYDHRPYWMLYRMSSPETVEITTKRRSSRSQSNGYPCRRTSHGDQENYREPYHTKPLSKMLTKWHTEGSRTIAEWHTKLNAKRPYPRPTKWLPRTQWIFYRLWLPSWSQRVPPRMHQSHHWNDFLGEAAHRVPTKCWIKRCQNLQMQCRKQLSEGRSALVLRWVWPPTVMLTR